VRIIGERGQLNKGKDSLNGNKKRTWGEGFASPEAKPTEKQGRTAGL
jgi:hypothetical protein